MSDLDTRPVDREAERLFGSARRRFQRRQWVRRWRAVRWPVLAAAIIALVGFGVWVVFFSSLLLVRAVSVEGAHVLTVSEVERVAAVPTGIPLAQVQVGAITSRVEELPAVKSATVTRAWPDTIQISLTERTAIAVVTQDGSPGAPWALSADGVLFARVDKASPGLPEIHVTADPSADTLREGADLLAALPESLAGKISFIDLGSPNDITLHLDNGDLVRWGSADQTDAKAAVLAVLLKRNGSVYDVSSPGQPTVQR